MNSTPTTRSRNTSAPVFGIRQWWRLTVRYWEVLKADRRTMLFLLVQAPIIALLLILLFKSDVFSVVGAPDEKGSYPIQNAPTLLFLLVMSAIWCGTCNSVREIVKEIPIYRRERLVNLRIVPYLFSKIAVLSLVLTLQTAALWAITELAVDYRLHLAGHLALFGWIFLAGFVAMGQGLFISACVKSSDQANSVLPLVLLPQVMFSGLLVPFEKMGPAVSRLANVMVGRWAFGGTCATTDLVHSYTKQNPSLVNTIPEVFHTEPAAATLALAILFVVFTIATGLLLRLKDRRS